MQQLLILSGKGGTGKTTVAGAFIKLSGAKAVADCDVEAPNLHLLMKCNEPPMYHAYFGMPKAVIDPEKCISWVPVMIIADLMLLQKEILISFIPITAKGVVCVT